MNIKTSGNNENFLKSALSKTDNGVFFWSYFWYFATQFTKLKVKGVMNGKLRFSGSFQKASFPVE